MHVLITGGAGFIGSHLADALLSRGDSVAVLDNLSTGSLENVRRLQENPRFIFTNEALDNGPVLDRLASRADVIVHLAAAVGVHLVLERPTETIETNVLGTHALLGAARRYGCHTLIASTSEVYGKGVAIPFSEEDDLLLGPSSSSRWGYAASKLVGRVSWPGCASGVRSSGDDHALVQCGRAASNWPLWHGCAPLCQPGPARRSGYSFW